MNKPILQVWLLSLFRPSGLAGVIEGERRWWKPLAFAAMVSIIPGWLLSVVWLLVFGELPADQLPTIMTLWLLFVLPFMALNVLLPALMLHLSLAIVGAKPASFRITLGCICYAQSPLVLLFPAFMTSIAWEFDPYLVVIPIGLWGWLIATIALNRAEKVGFARAVFFTVGAELASSLLMSFVSNHVIEAYKTPSESMAPTLQVGDHFHLNKLRYRFSPPERGDVIVFEKFPTQTPGENVLSLGKTVSWVKRIAGLSGDTVEMREDVLLINGRALPRCPAGTITFFTTITLDGALEEAPKALFIEKNGAALYTTLQEPAGPEDSFGPVRVPEGAVFVLGDNRDNSNDSRHFGSIPIDSIQGRATRIWWSNRRPRGFNWDRVGRDIMDSEEAVAPYEEALKRCPGMR